MTTRAVGASAGVLMPVLSFANNIQEEVYFIFHYPGDLDESVNDVGPSFGLVQLEYLIYDKAGGDITGGTTTKIDEDVPPSNATDLIETEFAYTIDMNNDQILVGHFHRDIANDNGDAAGEVLFFEISYTMADSW